jgi:peptide/nickel transport system permease protein
MRHRLLAQVVGRLAQGVVVLLLSYVFVFTVLQILPGNPIDNRINSPDSGLTKAQAEILRNYYGLNRPAIVQFWDGLVNALHGDLGRSLLDGQPVSSKIGAALPSTLALTGSALVVALVIAGIVALAAVYGRFRVIRSVAQVIPSLSLAIPSYVIGLALLEYFAFKLGWFSVVSDTGFRALVLPSIALGIPVAAPISQVATDNLRRHLQDPFVTVARARGLSEQRILRTGLLRITALPTLTIIGVTVGTLLGGAVVTETVFARAGIGFLMEQAVAQQDFPVLQGLVLLSAAIFTVVNVLVDLSYPLLDPRLSQHASASAAEAAEGKAITSS